MSKQQYTLNRNSSLPQQTGQMFSESLAQKGYTEALDDYGIEFKESTGQSTANNTGAYVDLLSDTLHRAALSRMEPVLDLVFENRDLVGSKGFGAYQIPRQKPTIAYEVAEGEVVNHFTEGIDDIVVQPRKVVVGTSLTWEIRERGMDGFARYIMEEAAQAVERKLTTDIVNGLAAGAGFTESGGISMTKVRDAQTKVEEAEYDNGVKYGFLPDRLVLTPTAHSVLQESEEYQRKVAPANARPGESTNLDPQPLAFDGMTIVKTPFLTAAQALVLHSKKNMLVKESDLQTFSGQISGRPYDEEIVALMSYVLAVIYPKSVAKVVA